MIIINKTNTKVEINIVKMDRTVAPLIDSAIVSVCPYPSVPIFLTTTSRCDRFSRLL